MTFLDVVVVFIVFGGLLLFMSEWPLGGELATGFAMATILVVLLHNSAALAQWQQNLFGQLQSKEGTPQ